MKVLISALTGAAFACVSGPALAFPPYRSTDGAPATPYEWSVRVGLGRLQRDDGRTDLTAPLLRTSLGLPDGFEVIGQLEYSPRANRIADGALGGKWATEVSPSVAVGVETFALLPVQPSTGGVGVESLLAVTVRDGPYRLHLNAGGFHDPRFAPEQHGWRGSVLGEASLGSRRLGVELFAKGSNRRGADVRAGVGVIQDVGPFDVRAAVHAGLSHAAPDVVVSLWVTTSFQLRP